MKITGKHPTKLNDPIIKHPAMHGKRWAIDYEYGPHTSFKKISKKQIDEFGVDNMDTYTNTKHNDVDIGYSEFYEDLNPSNKLTGGVGDATAPHNVDPAELSMGQTVEMEHTTDPDIATEIALDHLSEDPKYYTKLRKAGLAKELDQVSTSSGFGDPDHPINDKKRLGSDMTCTAGNNIIGKIGNTPDGHIEGFDDTAIIPKNTNTNNYTVDVDIQEPALDEGKNSPTNKKLWARALAAARSKFDVYPSAYANAWAANWYKKHGGGWRKKKTNESFQFENSEMAQSDLTKIIDYSEKLQSMFDANDNLEDWVKAKLNHACDYVATVRDYLKFYRSEKELNTEDSQINEKWSSNYKKSINCANPNGFSQKAHCRARQLRKAGIKTKSKSVKECYKEAVLELVREQNSSMAMGALKQLHNDAKELASMLTPETSLEDWVKSKLNLAGEYLDDVYHHLDHFGPSGRKYDNSLNEASNSGAIITGQNPTGKVNPVRQPTSTSTGQAQVTNPKINNGYKASRGPIEGSGEETLHDRPYDFFQYKRDNAKFGNGNMIKKNGKVSLYELAKNIIKENISDGPFIPTLPNKIKSHGTEWEIGTNRVVGKYVYYGFDAAYADKIHKLCIHYIYNQNPQLKELIRDVYFYLLGRNPILKNINIDINNYNNKKTPELDIIHGVVSGIPPQDIEHFVVDTKGFGGSRNKEQVGYIQKPKDL